MLHSKTHHTGIHHLWNIQVDKEILELGIFQLCISLGRVLVGLSLVFHMMTNLQWEIWHILAFFFFYQLGFTLMGPFSGNIINFLGVKHAISSRAFASIPYYLSLIFFLSADFQQSLLYIFPFMLLRATFTNASTVGTDAFLSHHLTKETRGKTMAWIQIAIASSAVLGPIVGGFITALFGFQYVAYIGTLVLAFGGIVLFLTPDEKITLPYSPLQVMQDLKTKVPREVYFSEWGRVFFDCIFWLIWPIFLVIALGDIKSMGLLVGTSSAIAMIVAFFIGKSIDKSDKPLSTMISHGAWRSTVLNFLRVIWLEPLFLATIDSLSKINDQTIKTPYELEVCRWIAETDSLERAHQRRIIAENFYTLPLCVLAVLFYFFPDPSSFFFLGIFSLAALSLLFLSQITKSIRTVDSSG